MKKIFLFLSITFVSLPAQAITWKEFWKPFNDRPYYHRPYYQPYHQNTYYVPMCSRIVHRQEYIPGDYRNSGYVRHWNETIRFPCDGYR